MLPRVLVHGGAGLFDGERVELCIAGCEAAVAAGLAAIGSGALDAAVAAVRVLEEDPSFNAGLGSTLTRDGTVELDAAIMTGDLRFGAVAACPPVASAIALARAVMDDGEHTLLAAEGAAAFAARIGVPLLGAEDLIVDRVREAWERRSAAAGEPGYRAGTVGAVAVDAAGGLAAATSTGGILYKRSGRVGDTPLPGAGTYADADRGVAASATGEGEAIMRVLLCREIADRVATGGSLTVAVAGAMALLESKTGGKAGVIAVTSDGGWHRLHNTRYMPWATAPLAGQVQSGA